ncbi:hypothetical protein HN51_030336 [Arachis hypogaea]
MMVELFVLGCTGIVVFLHGANFFFHALSQHLALRSLSYAGFNKILKAIRIIGDNVPMDNFARAQEIIVLA